MKKVKNGSESVSVWLRRFWTGVGWFGVALLLYLSLTPKPPSFDVQYGDKIGHVLAYATLMFWWAEWWVTLRQRAGLAAGLITLGIVIEVLQGWSGWRAFEYDDMIADAIGVALGWAAAVWMPNFPKLLAHLRQGPPK